MSIAQQVVSHLPYLRRYARALTGSQKSGDAYVIALLEALVEDTNGFDRKLPSRVALYRLFTRMWNSVVINSHHEAGASIAESRLDALTPQSRQAFLLTAMERFDEKDAALVLDKSVDELRALIAAAVKEIADQVATQVLIIEDEPLIAMDIEEMVETLGHRVVGTARTHREAIALFDKTNPKLILADIQLADGSSGIDAVNEILAATAIPVIFITAFPERLLTGERPEPAFLVTKPFNPDMVKALISQALFFDRQARAAAA